MILLPAVKTAADLNKPVTDILVFRGLISEDALGKLIAEYYKSPYVNLSGKVIPFDVLELVPEQAALQFHLIPFLRLKMINFTLGWKIHRILKPLSL